MNELYDPELEAIYNPEAAVEEVTPAADEVDETESAAVIEETAAADETEDEAAEDADATTTSDESADESEVSPPAEDSFDDLLDTIPTADALRAKYERIPNVAKDEMVSLADMARAKEAVLARVGGEDGVTILEPVHNLLTKAERVDADHMSALASMWQTNQEATSELLYMGAMGVLFNTNKDELGKQQAAIGDAILNERFGMNAEKIEKLALLVNDGIVDIDDGMTLLSAEGTDSPLYQSQQKTITALTDQVKELTDLVANPERITQPSQAEQNALTALDAEIEKRLADGIAPFRERVRWGESSQLAKTVTNALLAELRSDPDYKEAVRFAKSQGIGENIPYTINQKIFTLVNKGKSKFALLAADINKELKGVTATSLNAKVKEKVKETKPQAVETKPRAGMFGGALTNDPELDAIYASASA